MDDVKIEFEVGESDLMVESKLDMSMNSVVTVQNEADAQSSLDTSVISVIKVTEEEERKGAADDKELEKIDDIQAKAVKDDTLTLSLAQFECLVSDLKTKHLSEMKMIQCDLMLCKKTI